MSGEVEAAEENARKLHQGKYDSLASSKSVVALAKYLKVAARKNVRLRENVPHGFSWLPHLTDESCAAVLVFAVATAG